MFLAPCVDKYDGCNIYKPYCKHPVYKDFVEDQCKKTCDLCPKGKCVSGQSFFGIFNSINELFSSFSNQRISPLTLSAVFFVLVCFDRLSYCQPIKKSCSDTLLQVAMGHYCARTCGKCTGSLRVGRYRYQILDIIDTGIF